MGLLILLLILGLPIAEIAGFVEIGGRIGVLATLVWVLLAAVAGVTVIRLQGVATALQVRAALARDELPARALFDGACVVLAGFLLLFPGFVSDAVAVLLLLPPLRGLLFAAIARRVRTHVQVDIRTGQRERGVIIEGEFEAVDPEDPRETPPRRLPPENRGPS
jgi:UPF0716 protein FxsA